MGAACSAALCGDSLIVGDEKCDDGNASPGDGCSPTCHLEPGFKCDVPGQPCTPTVCGDGVAEGTEQCDDGDNDMGDGCTPFCVREPDCSQGACTSSCGDGIKLPNGAEECEDIVQETLLAIHPALSRYCPVATGDADRISV